MFNRFTIALKLKANSTLIILGLIISGVVVFNTLSSLSDEYKNSLHLASQNDNLKSIFINGLLYNSSSGVVFQNPDSKKAKNTMKTAIENVEKLSNKLKKLNIVLYNKLKSKKENFLSRVKPLYEKVKNGGILHKSDMKKSLQAWRELKFELSKNLKSIQSESTKSRGHYNEMIENSMIMIAVFMFMISLLIIVFNVLLSRSILNPLEVLKEAMEKLSSKDSKGYAKVKVSNTKDETSKIAHGFNKYLDKIKDQQEEDNIVINNVQDVVNEIKAGKLTTRVSTISSNQNTMALVSALNSMLDNLHGVLNQALQTLEKYQNQDFRVKTEVECEGEICNLLNGIDSLGESISKMLVKSKRRGLNLEVSSKTLLENVDILNKSSNEAAASLEETAAALEEVTSNVSTSTQKITQMSQLANDVTDAACKGQELATKTTKSMDEINDQVTSISEAITVIDQIAFQTNILSLNAAVEAATAGEAGKGFAVVAGEVRSLAARSAEAASEIKALVENATGKANEGKTISDEMIRGYESLNQNIEKTTQLISDISLSSKEQQTGIVQINDAVNALDRKTQQNANIASQTQEVAHQTQKIADDIVTDTENKEFIGKNDVVVEKSASKQNPKTIEKKALALKEEKINVASEQKVIKSNIKDDEWESF